MSVKTILVTGGNRGIGKAIVRQCAALGHTVYLGSRDLTKGQAAAADMQGRPGDIRVLQLNMRDDAQMERAVAGLDALDVLINNAGIISTGSGPSVTPVADMREVLDTNYYGPLRLIQLVLPLLRQSRDARIINMSSGMGSHQDLSQGNYASYRMSKAALNDLTILFAGELAGAGIKVNAMCPGWVHTDMGGAGAPRTPDQGADTATWLATADSIPTGKFFRDRKVIRW